jgi:uncharacterized RDD family membrane protein YckC
MNSSWSLGWNRLLAFALDYLVMSAYLVFLVAVSVVITRSPLGPGFRGLFADPTSAELTAFALLVAPVLLYFALFESSRWQATWGKRARRLQVVTVAGTAVRLPRSLIRNGLKLAPWELTHACLWRIPGWPFAPQTPPVWVSLGLVLVWVLVLVYVLSILTSRSGQAIYDRLAGTRVVPRKPAQ